MNSLKLLLLLIVILFGIYLFQLRFQPRVQEEELANPTPQNTSPMKSSRIPSPSISSSVSPSMSTGGSDTSQKTYQYPGSIDKGNNTYITEDNPQMVTKWYKDAISKEGFPASTVIQTTTNGTTFNKLSAAKDNKHITVEIRKPANSSTVTIIVSQ